MNIKRVSITLVICLFLATIAFGQETTGIIEGTVVDAQGGRIAGASVQVEGNAFSRTVTTDNDGYYRLLQVPAGTYSLVVTANGISSDAVSITVDTIPFATSCKLARLLSLAKTAARASVNSC